jgi:ferredoxin
MFLSKKHTVYVKNRDISFEVKSGKNLFAALEENGIKISSLCSGNGQCGKCKVRIESRNINKPTRLERRSLSELSISMGIRLACEYAVKSDIVIDTDELARRANEDPCVLSVQTLATIESVSGDDDVYGADDLPPMPEQMQEESAEETGPEPEEEEAQEEPEQDENEFKSVLSRGMFRPQEEPEYEETEEEDEEPEPEEEPEEEREPVIVKYTEPEPEPEEIPEEERDVDYSTDGILLIQAPRGITYFHYSAGIGGISAKDFIETDRTLADLLRCGELKQFLDASLRYSGYERAILILSEKHFEGENVFGLMNYCSFTDNGLFCEVIQPSGSPKDILKFFRFLNQTSGRKMIIPLDALEKIYFFNSGTIMGIDASLRSDFLFEHIKTGGKNPVTKISDDLMSYEKKNPDLPPDAVSLSVLFKTAALLYSKGLLSRQFRLADKMSLVGDGLEGGHHIRLIAKFSGQSFKIDSGHGILIPQAAFDDLFVLRNFIHAAIKYAEKRCGKPDTVIFYSLFPVKELADSMITLEMVPKRYHEVIRTFSEDPTLFAINFFHKSTVLSYIESTLKMGEDISLDDEIFEGIFEKVKAEFEEEG